MKMRFLLVSLLCVLAAGRGAVPAWAGAPPDASDGWRVMPIRSQQEFEQGKTGGEAEQHNQGIARSPSDPSIIYLSHDVGQIWKSVDAGATWRKCAGRNLSVTAGQSIEVDPVNPDIVFAIVDASYNYLVEKDYEGLYRSTDGGENWQLVLKTTSAVQRRYQHNVACDPTSTGSGKAMRWYAGFPSNGLYRSEDGGNTWTLASGLSAHTTLYAVHTHPTDGQTVYVASNLGLLRSTSKGTNLQALGNLPSGDVSSVAVNPQNPSMIYAVVKGTGLYRSSNGGTTFSLVRSLDAVHVFINPGYPEVVFLVSIGGNSVVSRDGGSTWSTIILVPPVGLGREYKTRMRGEHTGVVPNPKNANDAVAFTRAAMWKSTDKGLTFNDSSTLFTGYASSWWADGMAFDVADSNRFVLFCCDVSMIFTPNGGAWFERRRGDIRTWYEQGLVSWTGMHAGDFQPVPGSGVIVGSVGNYWDTKLVRSTDAGLTWQIVDNTSENNLFIAFHPTAVNYVFAGNKRSLDGGATFQPIPYLATYSASILGMCRSQPDTIYALNKTSNNRNTILRSDDRGDTWRVYTQAGWNFNRMDSKPTFAVDPADPNKVYTLNSSGDLAVFNGTTWRSLSVLALAGGANLRNFVRMVAVDPRQANVLYAEMNAAGLPLVFRSLDAGTTWEDITRNLSRCGSGAIMVHPLTGDLFYGSCFGTWVYPPPYESPNSIYSRLDLNLRVVGWEILAPHGAAGTLAAPLTDGYVEPRSSGLRTLRVTFTRKLSPASLAPGSVTVVGQGGGDVSSLVSNLSLDASGTALTILLSRAAPDAETYTVSVTDGVTDLSGQTVQGDRDVVVKALFGDVDGSAGVTEADVLAVRSSLAQSLDGVGARCDVDNSGGITGADMAAVRARLGSRLP